MELKLTINSLDVTQLCQGQIKCETSRKGSCGKLTISLLNHAGLTYHEGDEVNLIIDEINLFKGYVFKKQRTKEQIIETTCYDQLIYLKLNKETYVYEELTATQVIQKIAGDFQLKIGHLANTGYVIPSREEDIQTLIDIIYTALDLTLINTGQLFVLYDQEGSLTLKSIQEMRQDKILSTEQTLIDYDYTIDIETQTFNQIKLVRDNEEIGRRETFIEKDSLNMNRWGIIQQHEKVSENLTEGQVINLVQRKLALYNRIHRSLKVTELAGDPTMRAGQSLLVQIPNLGEINLNHWLVIEKCTHLIKNNEHIMELELVGEFQ